MMGRMTFRTSVAVAFAFSSAYLSASAPALAAGGISGKVLGAGAPIAGSTVTLWAASPAAPQQLAQTRTAADGRFSLKPAGTGNRNAILYLVAKGGQSIASKASGENSAIALMAVVGTSAPAQVVVNELTTVASVWTHSQVIDGTVIKGPALALKIAAGNVPSFVDLQTGGWGATIQDPLNGSQTPTMANFATSPPGGYVGGGLQMQTDLAIGPAGDVWVMNNWQDIESCFGVPNEALSTRCGGQGVTIFFGMAKPVRPPQIGPARPL